MLHLHISTGTRGGDIDMLIRLVVGELTNLIACYKPGSPARVDGAKNVINMLDRMKKSRQLHVPEIEKVERAVHPLIQQALVFK